MTEKIIWTDHGRIEEVLHRVKEERNVLYTIRRRKDKLIGDSFRRNCLLKHFIGGKLDGKRDVRGRRGRRRNQLLDDP